MPPLKLLLLHGYTQSGPLFHAKSRALIKHITKAFPHHEVSAIYPTGPLRLNPADIPGYEPPQPSQEGGSTEQQPSDDKIDAFGWYRRSNTADPPLYLGLEDGLAAVADVLRAEGPFDGVIGFSQGAAMAAMVASLLEPGRKEAFAHFAPADGVPFPAAFDGLAHPPFRFALCYCGFRSPGARYRAFYESPPLRTPVLHVLGTLDAVVDEGRSRALIEACAGDPEKEGKVVWHPGGHFLPSQRPYLDAAVQFIREQLEGQAETKKVDEEDVHDMELPF
ncbi:dihydrofolate reductase [Aspergillus ambiguus]|uniref:alpha/beta hydrolase n=1 Tax=Aspergillus ambiguus TaxID=176160 RepID=UPI003CCCFC15